MDEIAACQQDAESKGKRVFIKEMAFYLFPAPGGTPSLGSSFGDVPEEPTNPTLLPVAELAKFEFAFLIRHPYLSVPSYYRLSQAEKKDTSRVHKVKRSDLGYPELRCLFDFLRDESLIGSPVSPAAVITTSNGMCKPEDIKTNGEIHHVINLDDVCVINSEDLVEHPEQIVSAYCERHDIPFHASTLSWDNENAQHKAAQAIDRWGFSNPFHEAVLGSKGLQRTKKLQSEEQMYRNWVSEFGKPTADEIKAAADSQMADYLYLQQFVSG